MGLLGDGALWAAIERRDILIEPKPEEIKAASLDLAVGEEAFVASGSEIMRLEKGKLLILPAGEFALVVTRERVELGNRFAGHIGLRSFFARKGLVLMAGPQIDPGFKGRLHIALCNLSPTEIAMGYGEPFCTVEFFELPSPVEKPYGARPGDEYQGQGPLTSTEIRDIREKRGYALSEVIRDMRSIAQDVSDLRATVASYIHRSDMYLRIFLGALGIFTATVVALAGTLIAQALR